MANFNVNLPEPQNDNDDFSLINLASGAESEEPTSMASTLYDPAALTLDPKVRAALEAEEAEKDRKRALGEEEDELDPRDIALSPASPAPGKDPFKMDEESEDGLIDESPLCCCGMIPLRPSVLAVNILSIIIGIVTVAYSVLQLATRETTSTEGFETGDSLLLVGARYVSIVSVIGAVMLLIAGVIGVLLANDITFGSEIRSKKFSILLYQSILIMVGLIFFLLVVLSAYALATLKGADIYDASHWRGQVQKDPTVVCDTEISGQCAGFTENNECLLAFSEVLEQQQNCPGHFCYDFCQARETIQNSNKICAKCSVGYDWLACKNHEGAVEEGSGCSSHINSIIASGYDSSIGIVMTVLVTVVLTLSVASFRSCCLAPLE